MNKLLLSIFLLAGCVAAAEAGELRPLDQPTVCLDSATELKVPIRKITLAACNREETQNVRRGDLNTIYIGKLCLQAISLAAPGAKDAPEAPVVYQVVAAPCTGGPGQRWGMTSDGRISSGDKLCLGVEGADAAQRVTMVPCKEKTEDRTGQRWAIYGKF
jgi:hypothetical protein